MRISDWSSDVCSSDLADTGFAGRRIVVFKVRVDQHLTEHDALRREDLQQQRLRAVEILARKAGRAQTILIADHHELVTGIADAQQRRNHAIDQPELGIAVDLAIGRLFDPHAVAVEKRDRSEERRVGKEWVSTCRSRWWPYH